GGDATAAVTAGKLSIPVSRFKAIEQLLTEKLRLFAVYFFLWHRLSRELLAQFPTYLMPRHMNFESWK
ncbi:MAG: hypothetical protein K2X27_27795, partial [Candidatus Obscuribacterales bacterium]|nr:hypothetical protein [Candidatus Obscuribacterales bacterium]